MRRLVPPLLAALVLVSALAVGQSVAMAREIPTSPLAVSGTTSVRPAAGPPFSETTPAVAPRRRSRAGFWVSDDWRGGYSNKGIRSAVPLQSALVPILMYHHVRPINFKLSDAPTSDLTLPPEEFERELRYLKARGFTSASMEELAAHLEGTRPLPRRSVVFTFDDGYRDNYLYAYPLLAKYGFKGTFYVITNMVGKPDYATWAEVREMAAGGMEIGSHTMNHPDLARWLDSAGREKELVESKRRIQEALGVPVRALSYPSGSYNTQVVEVARKAGYTSAVTTKHGANHDRQKALELSRVRIHGTDSLSLFQWRIEQYFPAVEPVYR